MKFPNKVTTYRESSIGKITLILSLLSEEDLSPFDLYNNLNKKFETIEEFIDALDCLYALNRIQYDESRGVLCAI